MTIRFARPDEYAAVLTHYQACNYNGGINDTDTVLIAVDGGIIGAVRICTEDGFKILRGMQVTQQFQRKGTGRSMLRYLGANLNMNDCYCLPYTHLKSFYGIIGFREIMPREAPVFLAERLKKYMDTGQDVIIMKKSIAGL